MSDAAISIWKILLNIKITEIFKLKKKLLLKYAFHAQDFHQGRRSESKTCHLANRLRNITIVKV